MQLEIAKAATTVKSVIKAENMPTAEDMTLINAQALRELTPEEVYIFKILACNDLVDRDGERFTVESLVRLAELFVGKTMIIDHRWSAENQTARIYNTWVEERDGGHALMARCYMLRNDATEHIIQAIDGGILREVSVGCAIGKALCSICGEEYGTCGHRKGNVYDGEICICELHDPVDAYEMSFVAVPAQPGAGVTKGMSHPCWTDAEKARLEIENERWRYV